ncbi:MAG TPA: transporter [Gammaproteobacteria bacterium]|nr:transporter [Gammaproteobacteria bacterium]
MNPTLRLFAFSLLPVAVLIGAAAAGSLRAPGPRLRSAVLHFAGGVIFAVVAVELLPDVVRARALLPTAIGFAIGTALMLALRAASRRFERRADAATAVLPLGLLAAVGVDLLIDGLMIGIGFAAGARQGVLLAIALAFEMLALGLALAATLAKRGAARGKILVCIAALALLLIVGAVAGGAPLAGASGRALAGVLAFGSAALLFLVTEELLGEAHETQDSAALTAAFFLGFLVQLIIDMAH